MATIKSVTSIIDVKWFCDSIAVVKVDHGSGVEYVIGLSDDLVKEDSLQQIITWGDEFPKVAGKALFGDE